MMTNFEILSQTIENGELDLVLIDAVPRSVSTALGRALGESDTPSLYINEPFNRMRHDIEDAAGRIVQVALPALEENGSPLTIVTKNMARNLTIEQYRIVAEMSKGVVWSVRKPIYQIGALLTRIANDLLYEPGADIIPQGSLTDDQIKIASQFLESGPTSTNFSKTSWESLGQHYDDIVRPIVSVGVDGSDFTHQPRKTLEIVAKSLGLVFSQHMVDDWQNEFINANTGYNPTLDDRTHAWTRDAACSTSVKPVDDVLIDIERLPNSLQRHLEEIANPVYEQVKKGMNSKA